MVEYMLILIYRLLTPMVITNNNLSYETGV